MNPISGADFVHMIYFGLVLLAAGWCVIAAVECVKDWRELKSRRRPSMDFSYDRKPEQQKAPEAPPGFWQLVGKHKKANPKNGLFGSVILALLEKTFPTP